jgi:hypothetical protein
MSITSIGIIPPKYGLPRRYQHCRSSVNYTRKNFRATFFTSERKATPKLAVSEV